VHPACRAYLQKIRAYSPGGVPGVTGTLRTPRAGSVLGFWSLRRKSISFAGDVSGVTAALCTPRAGLFSGFWFLRRPLPDTDIQGFLFLRPGPSRSSPRPSAGDVGSPREIAADAFLEDVIGADTFLGAGAAAAEGAAQPPDVKGSFELEPGTVATWAAVPKSPRISHAGVYRRPDARVPPRVVSCTARTAAAGGSRIAVPETAYAS